MGTGLSQPARPAPGPGRRGSRGGAGPGRAPGQPEPPPVAALRSPPVTLRGPQVACPPPTRRSSSSSRHCSRCSSAAAASTIFPSAGRSLGAASGPPVPVAKAARCHGARLPWRRGSPGREGADGAGRVDGGRRLPGSEAPLRGGEGSGARSMVICTAEGGAQAARRPGRSIGASFRRVLQESGARIY